jgi:uncharacterized protein
MWEPIKTMTWIQTFTNKAFDFSDISANEIDIRDIAHSLSMQCRYNGHTNKFYSVAEHSVNVMKMVSQYIGTGAINAKILLSALLHDASEAYLCDIPRPLKPLLRDYAEIEKQVEDHILNVFDLSRDKNPLIKEADNAILALEKTALMGPEPLPWNLPETLEFEEVPIIGFSPEEAYNRFLHEYKILEFDQWYYETYMKD